MKPAGTGPPFIGMIIAGVISTFIFYEADVFWQDTGFVFGAAAVVCGWGFLRTSHWPLHHLYWRDNTAIGLARLGVIGGVIWCGYVLALHADPTITGIWTVLYALMAFAAIKGCGQYAAERLAHLNLRLDVYERANTPAALFIGAFTLATGMIFGGSMWGDATPGSLEYGAIFEALPGYEDGWWITPWFFLMGWLILVATVWIWLRRETGSFVISVRRDRNMADARAAALFSLSCAIPITYAVAGDYHGLHESAIAFSYIALPVLAHEIMVPRTRARAKTPEKGEPERPDRGAPTRNAEGWVYAAIGGATPIVVPLLSVAATEYLL